MGEAPSTLLFRPGLKRARQVRRRELASFLRVLCDRVAGGRGITCLITSDDELRELNRKFRGEDRATDVLSFAAAVSLTTAEISTSQARMPTPQTQALGEIAI